MPRLKKSEDQEQREHLKNVVRSYIYKNGYTVKSFCYKSGLKYTTFSAQLNHGSIRVQTLSLLTEILNFTDEDIISCVKWGMK